MQVRFTAANFGIDQVTQVLVKFYEATSHALKKTVTLNGNSFSLVPGSAPAKYVSGNFPDKPTAADGSQFYVTVTEKNLVGTGSESAPSATFSLSVPETPADVEALNPQA